jgi:hypothetical protein
MPTLEDVFALVSMKLISILCERHYKVTIIFGKVHSFFVLHCSQVFEIRLVPHKCDGYAAISMVSQLIQPFYDVFKRLLF